MVVACHLVLHTVAMRKTWYCSMSIRSWMHSSVILYRHPISSILAPLFELVKARPGARILFANSLHKIVQGSVLNLPDWGQLPPSVSVSRYKLKSSECTHMCTPYGAIGPSHMYILDKLIYLSVAITFINTWKTDLTSWLMKLMMTNEVQPIFLMKHFFAIPFFYDRSRNVLGALHSHCKILFVKIYCVECRWKPRGSSFFCAANRIYTGSTIRRYTVLRRTLLHVDWSAITPSIPLVLCFSQHLISEFVVWQFQLLVRTVGGYRAGYHISQVFFVRFFN